MNDPKSQQEPSMEEILASIRRIISEDDAEPDDSSDPAPGDAEEASPDGSEAEPGDAAGPDPADDDVLDLTEVVDEEPSLEAKSAEYDLAITDDSDLVEVVEAVDEPEPEPIEVAAAPEPLPAAPVPVPAPADDGLISPPPAGEATAQFSALAAAVAGDRLGQAMGVGARTIEDLVKEVMRPMIKEWLDAHLPELVERLVGREIDRMARRAEDTVDD